MPAIQDKLFSVRMIAQILMYKIHNLEKYIYANNFWQTATLSTLKAA